ncbi:unnamed protein product [Phaedon cochleariae]|uniref:Thymidylate kinase-like domain-containing protein n=1 Tax=Phaedon cochleariae TaxID=80249 RepID=A0A9P0D9B5_PHACE|nr:unnamed protein product [Phaedon cochleariae]
MLRTMLVALSKIRKILSGNTVKSVNPRNGNARNFCVSPRKSKFKFEEMAVASKNNMASVPFLYHSLQSILDVFEKPENKTRDAVRELLNIYERAKEEKSKHDAAGEVRSHPFIVLEGLDGSGKSTTGTKFAKKIGAKKWQTPPASISHIRHLFDDDKVLRTAYYSLGNYIAGLEVEIMLKDQPIVMDRYWHSTAAYAMVQWIHDNKGKYEMPPAGDEIYCWPDDLFKPDIVFFLDVSEQVRAQRLSRRTESTAQEDLLRSSTEFRSNVIKAYKNMYNPPVTVINSNFAFGRVLRELQDRTKDLLVE